MERVSFSCTQDLREKLVAAAAESHRSVSQVIALALAVYFEEMAR